MTESESIARWAAAHREAAIKRELARREAAEARGPAKVRFPGRVLAHLSGSQCAFDPAEDEYPIFRKVLSAPRRKDGSATVELDPAERCDLVLFVEVMEIGAAENTGAWDRADAADARADLNAARAALRALA